MIINRILCPTDFSDASAQAFEHAATIARWYHAKLTAMHALMPLVTPVAVVAGPADGVVAEVERARQQVGIDSAPATGLGIDVDVVVETGEPSRCILARAAALPADLIVMGTHGAGGFQHLILGSVTEKVLRKASCPVLTVPPRARTTGNLPYRQLLCPVDFSDSSLAALDLARRFADESYAELTVLHVLEWPWNEPPPPPFDELPRREASSLAEFRRDEEAEARGRLESLVGSMDARRPTRIEIRHGKAYRELLRLAAERQTDLIVIGVHGRNAVDLALFGSTTNQVVRQATCPVLTIRR